MDDVLIKEDAPKSAAKARSPRKRKPKKSKRNPLVWLIVGLAAAMCAGAFGLFCFHGYSGKACRILIPANSSAAAVGDSLRSALGSGEANRVMFLWRLMGGDASKAHGAYRIEPGVSSVRIARRLAKGAQSPVRLTFNNLRTFEELCSRVGEVMEFDGDDFAAACGELLPGYGFDDRRQYAAAFLPDTYEFYWTDSPAAVVEKLVGFRNSFWNADRRAKSKKLGLTPVQVATVASIAEEETYKADERPTIARLYLNRLAKGMKLQADPTVKFATGDFSLRRILNKHLLTESPYNTYRVNGLPPGPIRLAEATTIDGVLDAPANPYIYMCAREDFSGYHNFAADYATHTANARRYQAELNKRNIK
jgi:UPF0755 protein